MKVKLKLALALVILAAGSVAHQLYVAQSCLPAMWTQVHTLVSNDDSAKSRRHFAETLNIGGTITYTVDTYENRVLVVTQATGNEQMGSDVLDYLYDSDEIQARGFLSVNYKDDAGDFIWLNLSHMTLGQPPWWKMDIVA